MRKLSMELYLKERSFASLEIAGKNEKGIPYSYRDFLCLRRIVP